jgi:hypothetical protein
MFMYLLYTNFSVPLFVFMYLFVYLAFSSPQTKWIYSFLQSSPVLNTKILLLATLSHLHTSLARYTTACEYSFARTVFRFPIEYCDGLTQSIKLWGQKTPLLSKRIPEVTHSTPERRLLSSKRFL